MSDSASLMALSAVDGRYADKTKELRGYFSEGALILYRLQVEALWLRFFSESTLLPLAKEEKEFISKIKRYDVLAVAQKVKKIEREVNHDVKAVEIFLRERLEDAGMSHLCEKVHILLTSEDVTSVAYGIMISKSVREILYYVLEIIEAIEIRAVRWAEKPLLSLTHGQPATPTTVGKELSVLAMRLFRQLKKIDECEILVKWSGATGNWAAHKVAYPEFDWPQVSESFIEFVNKEMGVNMSLNSYTTQIEPHDALAELLHIFTRLNTIFLDLSRDMWGYISRGVFSQSVKNGEVGSSTMPHKVNPIDWENAEGNLGVANALFYHLTEKLPISRYQRDLSDSTAFRTLGTGFGHALIAYKSILRGIAKVDVNEARCLEELNAHPEVLSEAVQSMLRRYGVSGGFERLKAFTRAGGVTLQELRDFILTLDIPDVAKERLLMLLPEDYTGYSAEIARRKVGDIDD